MMVRGPLIAVAVLAAAAALLYTYDPFTVDPGAAPTAEDFARARLVSLLWNGAGVAVLVFFMVVAWRIMRAQERVADVAERAADAGAVRPPGPETPRPAEGSPAPPGGSGP
jgi:hypothetical protein